jgi:AcrR family transcriptional regulator
VVKRLEPKERRGQILAAAVELARDKGYHNLTRDGVAVAAGVSFGLVTRYFGSIDTLQQKVMTEAVEGDILEIIAAGLAIGDPIARQAPGELKVKAANLLL